MHTDQRSLPDSLIRPRASTTKRPSRTSRVAQAVQPLATSARTRLHANLPAMDPPRCATRSASTKPGPQSCQSLNVRTGTLLRSRGCEARRPHWPTVTERASTGRRSIVAALISISCSRTRGSRHRWCSGSRLYEATRVSASEPPIRTRNQLRRTMRSELLEC